MAFNAKQQGTIKRWISEVRELLGGDEQETAAGILACTPHNDLIGAHHDAVALLKYFKQACDGQVEGAFEHVDGDLGWGPRCTGGGGSTSRKLDEHGVELAFQCG